MELLQRSYPVLQILNPVHDVCSEPPEACYAAVVNTLIDGCWRRSAEGLPGGACGWQRGGLPQRRRWPTWSRWVADAHGPGYGVIAST